MLKRTNWTTEEVIEMIQGQKLEAMDGSVPDFVAEHNEALDSLTEYFRSFLIPSEEMGALAYDPDTHIVYHIGQVPPR